MASTRGFQSWIDACAQRQEEQRAKGCTSMSPAGALLAAHHDPEVLQGTASCLTSGCLPGGCRAMTHSSWLGGQFH
jgi:hypothetical protein